jgi:hypothetical protein
VLAVTGKNTIKVVMASLDANPYPSQSIKMGAMAKTGNAWLMTNAGMVRFWSRFESPIKQATENPMKDPKANPQMISKAVVSA